MADGEPVASKPFGMDNLFFGNPDNIEIPRLPSAVQPARQLAFRTRRETSHDDNDDDDDWQPDEDSDDDGEASAPVQTAFGVYSRAGGTSTSGTKVAPKRQRLEGGRAAQAKKVTADLDSEDEIIVQMKQQNYGDRDVAYHLISEGRINYDKKTIATRWARLRKALAEREDQLLDDDLTDWHEGEDEILVKSYHRAERQVEHEIEKARDKLWRYTADLVRHERPASRYSPRACKERYEALLDGTARVPPELDDDPEARRREHNARLEAKRREKEEQNRVRLEQARQAQLEAERKEQQRKDEAAARKAKRDEANLEKKRKSMSAAEERERARQEAEQAKIDARLYSERTKQEQKLRKEQAAAKKAQESEKVRQTRAAAAQEKAQKDLELREMKEAQARAKLVALQKSREIRERQQQARQERSVRANLGETKLVDDNEDGQDDDDEGLADVEDEDRIEEEQADDNIAGPSSAAAGSPGDSGSAMATSLNSPVALVTARPVATPVTRSSASSGVDKISPRKKMSTEDLMTLLQKRGVKVASKTSRKSMLSQLALLDKKMTMDELKKEMRARGLKLTGNKTDLMHRLATDDAAQSSIPQKDAPSKTGRAQSGGKASTNEISTNEIDMLTPDGPHDEEHSMATATGEIHSPARLDSAQDVEAETEDGEAMDISV